ncbi:MAG: hypothetical protein WCD31_13990 [Gillisia sp.]
MNKKTALLINAALIVVGGGLLIFTFSQQEENKYVEIIGIIVIMFGLYRSTNLYADENKNGD